VESTQPLIGVLMMAYGGPQNLAEVQPYLMDVRGGRPTSPEIIREVRERYRQIGGRSPILEQTSAQAAALQGELDPSGKSFRVMVGMRHWHPYIPDVLDQMTSSGIHKAVGLVMAPHYSKMSVGAYFQKIYAANRDVEISEIAEWHLLPGYLEALQKRILSALQLFPESSTLKVPFIFTAHSLPQRILTWRDPYPDQLLETVSALMERLGPHPYEFAFQSAAISPEPWLGPDASSTLTRLAAEGQRHALIVPIGFVCEHVEILYDVDIAYQKLAASLGIHLERIEMVHTAPAMMKGLAQLVKQKAAESGWL
jgi:protoporphyrin/coproporphyrin ferrochelatase